MGNARRDPFGHLGGQQHGTAIVISLDDIVVFDTPFLGVIAIDPDHCPTAKYDLAMKFIEWIAAAGTQRLIGDFKLLGKQLFTPNAQ